MSETPQHLSPSERSAQALRTLAGGVLLLLSVGLVSCQTFLAGWSSPVPPGSDVEAGHG